MIRVTVLAEDTCSRADVCAEHGLGLYIRTPDGTLLFDTGASEKTLQNARTMGVDLSGAHTCVLSHGHYDHTGGVPAFSRAYPNMKFYCKPASLGVFRHGEREIGVPEEMRGMENLVFVPEGVFPLSENCTLFSEAPQLFPLPFANAGLSELTGAGEVPDAFHHEQYLLVREGEKSVLFSGCAHRGIVNILERCRTLFGAYPAAAVSGFHLWKQTPYTDAERGEIRKTALRLLETPTVFYTGHCTGAAFDLMEPILGGRLKRISASDTVDL